MRLVRLFEPAAYAAASGAGCYWLSTVQRPPAPPALEGSERAEVAVLGGGVTGLSAALHLARAGADVALIDMHHPGWGASGRNGGFACIGGAKLSPAAIARRHGVQEAARFHAAERGAVELVSRLLVTEGISADTHSRGETVLAHSPRAFAALRAEAPEIAARHRTTARVIGREELPGEGLGAGGVYGGLEIGLGFALNPLKYSLGLADAASRAGVRLYTGEVGHMAPEAGGTRLDTAQGTLWARRLIVATNGYSAENLPPWMRARFLPVISSILVTRPLTEAELAAQGWTSAQMAYDTRRFLHYFRLLPERRFLFGMRGGLRATRSDLARTHARMRTDFYNMFPAWARVETPYVWSGLLCLSARLTPYAGPLGDWPGAHAGFAWHGNGVAMGTWAGAQLARLALGQPTDLPGFMQATPWRFPLGRARRGLFALAAPFERLADRLG